MTNEERISDLEEEVRQLKAADHGRWDRQHAVDVIQTASPNDFTGAHLLGSALKRAQMIADFITNGTLPE